MTVTRTKAPSYDFDQLADQYPSLRSLAVSPGKDGQRAWVAAFTERPEALESMLSDLIKQVYAKPGRIGQRPMPKEEEVNLDALLYGEYTDDPLVVVLPKLLRISHRQLCTRTYMSRRMYQRMFLPDRHIDKYWPTMDEIERIAKVIGKPASFFLEYRLMAAQAAFLKLIVDRPVIATRIYRDYLEVTKASPFLK